MYVEQLYTGCLAEAAYYIESNGEAAIIDPMRETAPYLELANKRGATIKYVFETHFHADFVSGHVDLARKTGASIVYGPGAETSYDVTVAQDGQEFKLGEVTIKALHTPGHTPESSCYLLSKPDGSNYAVFTGDTLFVGEVGRPDLAVKTDLTVKDLAGMLFDSLRNKLMPLADDVLVYPAHGAGSACGKNIGSESYSTIGEQKANNYALQEMSKEDFVKIVADGIPPAPQYFAKNAAINKSGYEDIDEIINRNTRPLSPTEVEKAVSEGAIVMDTRAPQTFCKEFVKGALSFGLDGSFASWVGTLITDLNQPIVIVADPGREEEAVLRLARVGYTNAVGYLDGGVDAWKAAEKEVDTITSISAEELAQQVKSGNLNVVDVRKQSEWNDAHVDNATLYPLDNINEHLNDLDKDKTYHIHCRSGYRSMVASSILRRQGYTNLIEVAGGFNAIQNTDAPILSGAEAI